MTSLVSWEVKLIGDTLDLNDCVTIFKHFPELTITKEINQAGETEYFLRSSLLTGIQDRRDASAIAHSLITRLNGAKKLYFGGDSVKYGTITGIDQQGRKHHVLEVECGVIRMRGGVCELLINGKSSPNMAEKLMLEAQQNDFIADAFEHFGRADNWFDLYKTYEVIRAAIPTKANKLSAMGWMPSKMESRFTETANYYRHARAKPSQPLLTFDESKKLLEDAMKQWLQHC